MELVSQATEKVAEGLTKKAVSETAGALLSGSGKAVENNQAKLIKKRHDLYYLYQVEELKYRTGDYRSKGKTRYTIRNQEDIVIYTAEFAWDEKHKNAVLLDGNHKKVGIMQVNIDPPKNSREERKDIHPVGYSFAIEGKKLGRKKTTAFWNSSSLKVNFYDWILEKGGKREYVIKAEHHREIAHLELGSEGAVDRSLIGIKNQEDTIFACLLMILAYNLEEISPHLVREGLKLGSL